MNVQAWQTFFCANWKLGFWKTWHRLFAKSQSTSPLVTSHCWNKHNENTEWKSTEEVCSLPSAQERGSARPEHGTSLHGCPSWDGLWHCAAPSSQPKTTAHKQICQAPARLRHHAKTSLVRNYVAAFSQNTEERNQKKKGFFPLNSKIFSGKTPQSSASGCVK